MNLWPSVALFESIKSIRAGLKQEQNVMFQLHESWFEGPDDDRAGSVARMITGLGRGNRPVQIMHASRARLCSSNANVLVLED